VLLVAMIGAIVLTLRHRPGVKRQNIAVQNARTPATDAMSVRKVTTRADAEAGEWVHDDRSRTIILAVARSCSRSACSASSSTARTSSSS
jgi:uncharacterized membrane protein